MSRHYHIITCDDIDTLENFVNSGKVGVRPVETKSLNYTVRMNWDILADIARVKQGDYVLLHAKGIIKGVFEVVDDPVIEQNYDGFFNSRNINTDVWSNNWNNISDIINQNRPIWWIPIDPVQNMYFEEMNMDLIFDRIAKGVITSLPQRLIYEDKNKTVKGITKIDFYKIINLFRNYSSPTNPQSISSQLPRNKVYIDFDYLTNDGYEKNLEAIIVHRLRSETMNISNLNFYHSNVLNTVPLGYLKMADIITWSDINDSTVNPWIWELKTSSFSNFNNLQEEIRKLSIRASYIKSLLNNGYKITGVILAASFSNQVIQTFNNLILPIGLLEEIILISYNGSRRDVSFNLVARR